MNLPLWKTISSPGNSEYKEKGSKFLGYAVSVQSIEEAKSFIEHLRELHPKAVHVCFAWRIGFKNPEERYSDDGEPNNSAGKPIFGQIIKYDVHNCCVAIVRYYGGTKLGVGGLINAYKQAADEALSNSIIQEKEEEIECIIHFPFDLTGEVLVQLQKLSINILIHDVNENGQFVKACLPLRLKTQIEDFFKSWSSVEIQWIETLF